MPIETTIEAHLKSKLFKHFQDSPNINELLEVGAVAFQDTKDALDFLSGKLSDDDISQELLDFAGKLIGVQRPVEQEPRENIFTLLDEGESGDEDKRQGFADEDDETIGGYFSDEYGLPVQGTPSTENNDTEYRRLIKQKAASFRTKMLRVNLFSYYGAFDCRILIDDEATMDSIADPIVYYSLSDYEMWYIIAKGFKPGGISTSIREKMRNEDAI